MTEVEVFNPASCGIATRYWILILTESRSDLVHIAIAHGRRLYDRSRSLGLLDLARERHAGASRTDHGKHKHGFSHRVTPRTGEPIPPKRFRNKRNFVSGTQKSLVNLNLSDQRRFPRVRQSETMATNQISRSLAEEAA